MCSLKQNPLKINVNVKTELMLVGLCTFLAQANMFGKSPSLANHVTSQKLLDQSEPFETKEIHANEVNRTTWSGNQNNHSETRSNLVQV